MFLKLEHSHSSKREQTPQQINTFSQPVPNEHYPRFFKDLLLRSENQIDKKSIKSINESIEYRQKKVYSTLLPQAAPNYLAVMFQKANPSQQSYIQSLMGSRQSSIMQKIMHQQLQVKQQQNNDTKIKRIKNELDEKIKSMKQELGDLNISQIQYCEHLDNPFAPQKNHSNQSLVVLEEFKKKQYWKEATFSEQGKRIKSFLSKMKKQKSQLEAKYNKDIEDRLKKVQSIEQQEKQKVNEEKHQKYMQNLQKQYKQRGQLRKQHYEKRESKIKQIENFLASVNNKEPSHLRYEKDFKDFMAKQEQKKGKLLKQIKQKHPTYSPQQVEQHMSKYRDVKQKYNQQKQMKAAVQEQILSKRYQEIRQLYHSKHHQSISKPYKEFQIAQQSLNKNRDKVKQYANTVKEAFKPLVDRRKRQQLVNSIKMLELSQDPKKKKVVKENGVVEFQDRPQNDAYDKGVSYLEQLRSVNEVNKSRLSTSKRYDERSNSALQLSSHKKIDYLRESRPSLDLKPTISDWKDLLQKKDYSQRDKLQRVMDRAESLEIHAKQKQVQLRNMKRQSEDVLSVREESDKYYLESIAARMVLLKDVVMK